MAATGFLHFICGRYCNYRLRLLGANLSGPVVQLSLVVSLFLAITALQEARRRCVSLGSCWRSSSGADAPVRRSLPAVSTLAKRPADRSVAAGLPLSPSPLHRRLPVRTAGAACYGVTLILIRIVVERGQLADSMALLLLLVPPLQWSRCCRCGRTAAPRAIDRPGAGQVVRRFGRSGDGVAVMRLLHGARGRAAGVGGDADPAGLHLVFRYVLARLLNLHHESRGADDPGHRDLMTAPPHCRSTRNLIATRPCRSRWSRSAVAGLLATGPAGRAKPRPAGSTESRLYCRVTPLLRNVARRR